MHQSSDPLLYDTPAGVPCSLSHTRTNIDLSMSHANTHTETSHSHRAVRHTHNTCLNVLSAAAAAGGDRRPVNVAAAGSQRRAD